MKVNDKIVSRLYGGLSGSVGRLADRRGALSRSDLTSEVTQGVSRGACRCFSGEVSGGNPGVVLGARLGGGPFFLFLFLRRRRRKSWKTGVHISMRSFLSNCRIAQVRRTITQKQINIAEILLQSAGRSAEISAKVRPVGS